MSNEHPDMHGNWVDGPDEQCEVPVSDDATNEHHTFDVWCQAFDAWYMKTYSANVPSFTSNTGVECWRESYDSGMTPKEAFEEDCANA